ncbi:MAG: trimeric intracellular cation channel family protein [Candidatus Angelobacter sp.]
MILPNYPQLDMFSAGVNALYGLLVAGQPSHNRGFTAAGLVIMAFFGGIGGGVARDVLLNDIPSPFRDPTYLLVCVLMALLGLAIYRYAATREERFRTRTMAFLKSFTLPWFAILGAHKALEHGLGIWTAILIGVIATNAGGVFIDIFSGITPEIVKPSQQLFTASVLAGTVYTLLWQLEKGRAFFPVTLIAVGVTFIFRVLAVEDHFPSIVPIACPEGPEVAPPVAPARPLVHR